MRPFRFLGQKSDQEKTLALPPNPFRHLFDCRDLSLEEKEQLRTFFPEKEAEDDFRELCQLTVELRSIRRQLALLVGERLFKAREILRRHQGEKLHFRAWINSLGMSPKTAYNAIAFYQLYKALPSDALREQLRAMPAKISYRLASKEASMDQKVDFINDAGSLKERDLLLALARYFPSEDHAKKSRLLFLLEEAESLARGPISENERAALSFLVEKLALHLGSLSC